MRLFSAVVIDFLIFLVALFRLILSSKCIVESFLHCKFFNFTCKKVSFIRHRKKLQSEIIRSFNRAIHIRVSEKKFSIAIQFPLQAPWHEDFPSQNFSPLSRSYLHSMTEMGKSFGCCCSARRNENVVIQNWCRSRSAAVNKSRRVFSVLKKKNSLECEVLVWQLDNGSRARQWHGFSMSWGLLIRSSIQNPPHTSYTVHPSVKWKKTV